MAPLGERSTAQEALQGADLTGKTAIVTGGNSGIGVETVRALAGAGARTILTSRSVPAGQAVADAIKAGGAKGAVVVKQLDLADLASVDAFAKDIIATEERIDFLILNAGVGGVPLSYTKDGFEMQMGVNHFGHFALTKALLPKMKAQAFPSRIVVVASRAHERGHIQLDDLNYKHGRHYSPMFSYHHSKLANVLFAKELAHRLEGSPVSVFSLHPGVIFTEILRYANPLVVFVLKLVMRVTMRIKSVEQGAATTIYAAVSPKLEGKSGAYLSDCAEKEPSAEAQDAELARKLWEVTEQQLAEARKAAGLSLPEE